MAETVPAAPSDPAPPPAEKAPTKKRAKKPGPGVARPPRSCSVSRLIPEALSSSQERAGMSLAALKKALAAAGYDVEKNNSRIKLALKSLVSKGVLVQTKGTGASGSFKLSRKAAPAPHPRPRRNSGQIGKLGLPKGSRSPKAAKKPKVPARNATGGKTKGAPARKSPAKARAASPKAGRPKVGLQKGHPRKAAAKK